MPTLTLSPTLSVNLDRMRALFEGDNTFVARVTESPSGLRCAVFFLDGMVNNLAINQSIIRPLVAFDGSYTNADTLARTVIQINDSRVETDPDSMLSSLLYGDTVILTEGDARPVVVNTKGFSVRSSSEPDNEKVLRGPREGFTEAFMPNLALIRRRLNDPRLKFSFERMGERTHTVVCVCYLKGVTDDRLVRETRRRLDACDLDGILDANYLAECIRDERASPFPTLGTTERPDVVVARLLEGRLAILVDGSPVVLTAPCILQECFQANDDYYLSTQQAGLSRVLRVAGFFLSVSIPALYAALLYFHPELLPTRLLLAVAAAQKGVPLPPIWEIMLLLIVFEVLKEAGTRTPGVIGSTMSIVGGLVLGQAAVSARFISAPAVIIVAVSAVTGLTVPKLQAAALTARFALLACAALFGLYGLCFGLSLMLLHLCALTSCGTPYLLNLLPRVTPSREDRWLRAPWFRMRKRRFLAKKEKS